MKEIVDFILNNDVDVVRNKLNTTELTNILNNVGFVPGDEFLKFINEYSYLAFEDIEFFGINSELKEKSNINYNTWMLHKNYESTKGFYIVENRGDGYYILVDNEDNIFNFFAGDSEKPEAISMNFYSYVIKRLNEAKS